MQTIVCHTILFALILASSSPSEASRRSSYGESCDKDKRCDTRALLFCSSQGSCQCLLPHSMVFDSVTNKCVALAGERCAYTTIEGGRSWSEEVPCVSNARCVSRVCTCGPGYFETSGGSCELQRGHGRTCSDNPACTLNLVCGDSGKCECGPRTAYDRDEDSCVLVAGAQCTPGVKEKCVKHAKCQRESTLSKCVCEPPYIQSSNGTCESQRGYGEDCAEDNQCENNHWTESSWSGDPSNLVCTNGKCSCNSSVAIENGEMSRGSAFQVCVTLAGFQCDPRKPVPCVSGSICLKDHLLNVNQCTCTRNYFRNESSNLCQEKKGYGERCYRGDYECAQQEHLVCGVNGHCDCSVDRAYDEDEQKCLLRPGQYCGGLQRNSGRRVCVSHAKCDELKMCKCEPGYFASANGTCEEKQDYGGQCSDSSQCKSDFTTFSLRSAETLLVCRNGVCACNESVAMRNPKNSSEHIPCLRLAGERCYDDHDLTDECTFGAECTYENGDYFKQPVCSCRSDVYFEDENRTCVPMQSHGGSCGGSNKCRENLHLACGQNGTCECNQNTLLDPTRNVCVAKAGSSCNGKWDLGCVPNAHCINSQCVCNSRATSVNGYCYITEGNLCDNAEPGITGYYGTCVPGLVCQNDSCSCPFPGHQRFDALSGKCISLIDGPCSNGSMSCVDHGECVAEGGVHLCRCEKGFVPVNRECDLAYGELCSQGQRAPKCDRQGPLHCSIRGKCECPEFQRYNNETLQCTGLVGAKCKDSGFCGENSICRSFRGTGSSHNGICLCQPSYVPLTDRTCGKAAVSASAFP